MCVGYKIGIYDIRGRNIVTSRILSSFVHLLCRPDIKNECAGIQEFNDSSEAVGVKLILRIASAYEFSG